MNKKVIILTNDEGVITDLLEIKTYTDESNFLSVEKKAKENKAKLLTKEKRINELNKKWFNDNVELLKLENEILKNHIRALTGELTDEECESANLVLSDKIETLKSELEQLNKERKDYGLE